MVRGRSTMKKWCLVLAVIAAALPLGIAGCAKPTSDTGNLRVVVQGAGDGRLAGVKVVSNTQPDGQLKVTGITGGEGTVTFNGMKAGQYEFYVSGAGYTQQEFSVDVAAGRTKDITVTLVKTSGRHVVAEGVA